MWLPEIARLSINLVRSGLRTRSSCADAAASARSTFSRVRTSSGTAWRGSSGQVSTMSSWAQQGPVVDLSAAMLDHARRVAEADGLANVSFVQADAQIHPFEPASLRRGRLPHLGDVLRRPRRRARQHRPGAAPRYRTAGAADVAGPARATSGWRRSPTPSPPDASPDPPARRRPVLPLRARPDPRRASTRPATTT